MAGRERSVFPHVVTTFQPILEYPGGPPALRPWAGVQSARALLGSLSVLAALPLAILTNTLFGGGELIVVHAALGLGMLLLAASVGDFRGPGYLSWIGASAMLVLGAIFLGQGIAEVVQSPPVFAIVYGDPILQAVERFAAYPILLWCASLLVTHSKGKSRVLGAAALLGIAAVEVYAFWVAQTGGTLDIAFRLAYLLAFVWLALEGAKPRVRSVV
jgi:hypothetical protein